MGHVENHVSHVARRLFALHDRSCVNQMIELGVQREPFKTDLDAGAGA